MRTIVGIDIGKKGAIAQSPLDGLATVRDVPTFGENEIDPYTKKAYGVPTYDIHSCLFLTNYWRQISARVFIEKNPDWGSQKIKQAEGFHLWKFAFAAVNYWFYPVHARTWQAGVLPREKGVKAKVISIREAKKNFPHIEIERDDIADALNIMAYGFTQTVRKPVGGLKG